MSIPATTTGAYNVAIIGGGITGACTASALSHLSSITSIDIFDQGQSGPGGRSNTRTVQHDDDDDTTTTLKFDHGCQFFRADTDKFRHEVVNQWMKHGWVEEWKGRFISGDDHPSADFFGMPRIGGPYYVGSRGMKSLPVQILEHCPKCHVSKGTRISGLERHHHDNKWHLKGVSGKVAYHDTDETIAQTATPNTVGPNDGYDAVVLTDVSSSFGSWHRASAGVPPSFAQRVRDRCGPRTPLFSAMIAYPPNTDVGCDAMSFGGNDVLWYAARMNSKPGMMMTSSSEQQHECWTLVSTPHYAMRKIAETPMRSKDGTFRPQTKEYLSSVPGPELEMAFRNAVTSKSGMRLPEPLYVGAQRWGSAMPSSRRDPVCIEDVEYSANVGILAPTSVVRDGLNYVAEEELMLFQAGDMVSKYSPGLEGAALSGMDVAERIGEIWMKGEEL